jgi:ribosomal protein L11 methyltransferase
MPGLSESRDGEAETHRRVLALIAGEERRWTAAALEGAVARRFGLTRRQARSAIRRLTEAGELSFSCDHGCSFVDVSYRRPVQVGRRIVLVPADMGYRPETGRVAVRLERGAAFGCGSHPTTRLALRGVEHAVQRHRRGRVLDVGTGTGVLLVAALALGVDSGLGVDIDPCARFEALRNIGTNGMSERAAVTADPVETLVGSFGLVCANLRSPTLSRLAKTLAALTEEEGSLVMSGLREDEIVAVADAYRREGMCLFWVEEASGWAGAAFAKKTSAG